VHAEANAIAYAARWGISLEGAELFTSASPCLACCQLIVNSGMVRVSYGKLFRETMGVELLIEAGIVVEQWA
jgi:dCMP deaminase